MQELIVEISELFETNRDAYFARRRQCSGFFAGATDGHFHISWVNYRFPWNNLARIFQGESGAYLLGCTIAVLFLMAI